MILDTKLPRTPPGTRAEHNVELLALFAVFVVALLPRLWVIHVGAPFITIDDKTAFEGGFLVWFGNAPPQRTYIESWLYGIVEILVFACRQAQTHHAALGVNAIADAYKDYYGNPSAYVQAFRSVTILIDLATTISIYYIGRELVVLRQSRWLPVLPAALYAISYNVLWCGLVSRPDSVLVFYSALGTLLYLRSRSGTELGYLLASAVVLGLAAGQKLHGALITVLLTIDLIRAGGARAVIRRALPFSITAFICFAVAAGTLVFDPLDYVKMRMANYSDDYSPWLHWGQQFPTMLRGSGWLAIPVILLVPLLLKIFSNKRTLEVDQGQRALVTVAIGALLMFASIRQLRAYWMLPYLPVIYIVATTSISGMKSRLLRVAVISSLAISLGVQTLAQASQLKVAHYTEMTTWLAENAANKVVYLLGNDSFVLPKNTRCISRSRSIVEEIVRADEIGNLPFTLRHAKNWEERSNLRLMDMLDWHYDSAYEYYDFYTAPPKIFSEIVGLDGVDVVLLADGFDLSLAPELDDLIHRKFVKVGERIGAGGGSKGLKYEIFVRA